MKLVTTFILIMCFLVEGKTQLKSENLGRLSNTLIESSGLIYENSNSLWTLNDGGSGAHLYNIDSTGKIIKKVSFTNLKNHDWESLHLNDQGMLFIGDFGNNLNARKNLKIHMLLLNDLKKTDTPKIATIEFSYEDQKRFPPSKTDLIYDCEAMVWHDDSIFLITKNRTKPFDGNIHIYALPAKEGKQIAKKIITYHSKTKSMYHNWVTDADLLGTDLYLLSHNKIFRIPNFTKNTHTRWKLKRLNLDDYSQKEAMAFGSNKQLYITNEKFGPIKQKLIKVSLP